MKPQGENKNVHMKLYTQTKQVDCQRSYIVKIVSTGINTESVVYIQTVYNTVTKMIIAV